MSNELPNGWARARLNDVLEPGGLFDGPFGSNLKTDDYTDSGIRVIRLENLTNLRFVDSKEAYISEAKYKTLTKHTVVAGDILVGSFVDGAVRVCVLPELPTKAIAKADCFTVRTRTDAADRRFIALQLGSSRIRDTFIEDIHGTTRPRITTKQLRECELAFAPLSEQRRIVEKAEALLADVSKAQQRLDQVLVTLKRFRQVVLAAACSGELTREWRTERQPSTAPTVVPIDDDLPELPDLPAEWSVLPLERVTERLQYGTSEKADVNEHTGDPVLRMGNIQDGRLDLTNLKFIRGSRSLDDFYVSQGDVLFNRTNSPELVGKAAVVDVDRPMLFASYLIRIQVKRHVVRPEFVAWWLNSAWGRMWARQVRTDGVSQSNINSSKLAAMPLPIPSVDEQDEALRLGGRLLSHAQAVEHRVRVTTETAGKLPQAILSKAFSGELVPQDPADEPASALLARTLKKKLEEETMKPRKRPSRTLVAPAEPTMPSAPIGLREAIGKSKRGLTPEDLFARAGYRAEDPEAVSRFYQALREAVGKGILREERASDGDPRILAVQ